MYVSYLLVETCPKLLIKVILACIYRGFGHLGVMAYMDLGVRKPVFSVCIGTDWSAPLLFTFLICIISKFAAGEIPIFQLFFVAEETGLSLARQGFSRHSPFVNKET